MLANSWLNSLTWELLRKVFQFLPRSERTSLYLLYSQGGYKKKVKESLDWAAIKMSDSVVRWEVASAWEETLTDKRSFLLSWDGERKLLKTLPNKTSALRGTSFQTHFNTIVPHNLLCRWNGGSGNFMDENIYYVDKKELRINTFDERNSYTHDMNVFDVLVIYLKPDEEVFWKLCSANSIPLESLAVDMSSDGEPLFLGYREGEECIEKRMGYVRAGKGLMHHHITTKIRYKRDDDWEHEDEIVETRWEVSEGFWVLSARKKMFG